MDEERRKLLREMPEADKLKRIQAQAQMVIEHVDCSIDYALQLLHTHPDLYSGDPAPDVQVALTEIGDMIVKLEEIRDEIGVLGVQAVALLTDLHK